MNNKLMTQHTTHKCKKYVFCLFIALLILFPASLAHAGKDKGSNSHFLLKFNAGLQPQGRITLETHRGTNGGQNNFPTTFGFQLTWLNRVNPYFSAGISNRMTFLNPFAESRSSDLSADNGGHAVLDLNLAIRIHIPIPIKGRNVVEFYLGVDGGLSLGLLPLSAPSTIGEVFRLHPGWNINPIGGVAFNVTRQFGFFVEAGWHHHSTNYRSSSSLRKASLAINWNEVSFQTGIVINY